jgi:hypothetical protein
MKEGVGEIRLRLKAAAPLDCAGEHRLDFLNDHLAKLGTYLTNVLVPKTDAGERGATAAAITRRSYGEDDLIVRVSHPALSQRVRAPRSKTTAPHRARTGLPRMPAVPGGACGAVRGDVDAAPGGVDRDDLLVGRRACGVPRGARVGEDRGSSGKDFVAPSVGARVALV